MGEMAPYEIVVGLEIHAQLLTESKLFSGDRNAFGGEANTHISAITLAHPGTLPKMNEAAIALAVKMGIACNCEIVKYNYFARKNYFYPDLPKGYQLSQHTTPVCKNGHVSITTSEGVKKIRLQRIHMEEDAGKSIHDIDENYTCLDYNRAGTPLIEIVTEPDIRSADEAFAFVTAVRKLVRYLGICDGNMEEGSLRCDVNISVRKQGDIKLGTRVEIKNLNSIRNVKRAVDSESRRLIDILEEGESIKQETRSYDGNTGISIPTREKEEADDYRYFADPDLTPFELHEEFIEGIRSSIPILAESRAEKYISKMHLSAYDANLLSEEREFSDYFDALVSHTSNYKAAANWMLGPVKSWMNDNASSILSFPLSPEKMASLVDLVDGNKVSFSIATTKLWQYMLADPKQDPADIAVKENLLQQSDSLMITEIIDQVLAGMAGKVAEYKKGKKGLLALFVGEVMKMSKGKADPKMVNNILLEKLKN